MEIRNKLAVTKRDGGGGKWRKEGEGSSQGTCIKDPWTWTRMGIDRGSGGWVGQGRAMGGKLGQL